MRLIVFNVRTERELLLTELGRCATKDRIGLAFVEALAVTKEKVMLPIEDLQSWIMVCGIEFGAWFYFFDFCRDLAKQASLMAFAAPKVHGVSVTMQSY